MGYFSDTTPSFVSVSGDHRERPINRWLFRDGTYQDVGYYGHIQYCFENDMTEEEAEKRGWVKITTSAIVGDLVARWAGNRLIMPSPEQVQHLISLGFDEAAIHEA